MLRALLICAKVVPDELKADKTKYETRQYFGEFLNDKATVGDGLGGGFGCVRRYSSGANAQQTYYVDCAICSRR